MADVTPNYSLERQRLELDRAQQLFNIQSQTFRIAQARDEIERIEVNIAAAEVAIAEIDKTLAALPTPKQPKLGT